MNRTILIALIFLTACGPAPKDYDAMAKCGNMGLKVGTAEYQQCVKDETQANLLARHRADMERMQEQREYDRTMRSIYH